MQYMPQADDTDDAGLVAAGDAAAEAGFSMPVFLTAAAWSDCVAWSEDDSSRQLVQSEASRLWRVLDMAAQAFMLSPVPAAGILFPVYRIPRDGHTIRPAESTLRTVLVTDRGEPVVIISLMNEGCIASQAASS